MLRTHCLVHSVLGECSTPENAAINNAGLVLPAPGYRRTESRPVPPSRRQGNENARRAIGFNKVHVPVISKIILLFKFLASFFFGFFLLKSGRSHRNRAKVATCAVALLFILSFLLDLFWYSYSGHLQSSATFTALYFVRHLVGGVIVAMGGTIIHARSAKVVLMSSVALIIGFVVYGVVISELRHIPVTVRFFCFSGLFIGMFGSIAQSVGKSAR
jgi:hypothetical protein